METEKEMEMEMEMKKYFDSIPTIQNLDQMAKLTDVKTNPAHVKKPIPRNDERVTLTFYQCICCGCDRWIQKYYERVAKGIGHSEGVDPIPPAKRIAYLDWLTVQPGSNHWFCSDCCKIWSKFWWDGRKEQPEDELFFNKVNRQPDQLILSEDLGIEEGELLGTPEVQIVVGIKE